MSRLALPNPLKVPLSKKSQTPVEERSIEREGSARWIHRTHSQTTHGDTPDVPDVAPHSVLMGTSSSFVVPSEETRQPPPPPTGSYLSRGPDVHSDLWDLQGTAVCYEQRGGRPYIPYGRDHTDLARTSCRSRGFTTGIYDNAQGLSIWTKDQRPAGG